MICHNEQMANGNKNSPVQMVGLFVKTDERGSLANTQ
jgi:hypothetical protein